MNHEVLGEAINIPFYGAVEDFCGYAVQRGQVRIQHDLLAAYQVNGPLDSFNGDE